MEDIVFLSLAEVIEVHKDQVEHYGGHPGLRDYDLLCSAVALPEATYGGVYLHSDIFEMAAAYLYHICKNHPFVDGNKRIGMLAMMVFLELNSAGLTCSDQDIIETGLKLAAGEMADKQLLEWILRHN